MNTNNLSSIIHELVTNRTNTLSNRYYNQPPVGGYQVNEEYEYVLPDNDDLSSTVLLEIVTRFGSPEVDSFMKSIKREQIKLLSCKKVKASQVNGDFVCPICIEPFKQNEHYRELSCQHCFHKKCIDRWFKREHTDCPMCRTQIIV
jgi:hypothetical protein